MNQTSPNGTDRIYLDHAASTPVDPRVLSAMAPYWEDEFANPNGIHTEGLKAKSAVESARQEIAQTLQVTPDTITFTSGGTEGNNLAVFGIVDAYRKETGCAYADVHLVTSAVEHSSVLDCFLELEQRGAELTILPVDSEGKTSVDDLKRALRANTVMVSIMYANSEIGVINSIRSYAKVVADYRTAQHSVYPLLHTDASQVPSYLPCAQEAVRADLITFDAQKIYGPKGVGCLYHRAGVSLLPVLHGGGQEKGLRPGTVPTPLVVGLAKALSLAASEREIETERLSNLRDGFIDHVLAEVPGSELNGARDPRLANNVNISFPGKSAEMIVLKLSQEGVAVATKSVCKGAAGPSHVIAALGKGDEYALSAIRFSLGKTTTEAGLQQALEALRRVVG